MKRKTYPNNTKSPSYKDKSQEAVPIRRVLPYYQAYKTCSICGAELPGQSKHICDSCSWFLKQKRAEGL